MGDLQTDWSTHVHAVSLGFCLEVAHKYEYQ